jgi:hypothetical protein
MMIRRASTIWAACAIACAAGCSASGWRASEQYERWTLYSRAGEHIDPAPYRAAFEPAFRAVEDTLGPFKKRVDVYASSGDPASARGDGTSGTGGDDRIREVADDSVREIPGIGPARVRAFHSRDSGLFSTPSGIFVSAPEPGTAAHELVHARFAEDELDLPLWLEEGIACFIGDGILYGDRWVVDGLSCWPLYELGQQRVPDDELARLVRLHARDDVDARTNVMVHFTGWAIVFDLFRESGRLDVGAWRARYAKGIDVAEARAHLDHTLAPDTALEWLKRLDDPRPEVRLAAAKGVWKLRSVPVVSRLLDALRTEQDPTVDVGLAINALAAAGEMRLPPSLNRRMWSLAGPAIRRAKLDDPAEQAATVQLSRSFWSGGQSSQPPLQALRRFWAE